MIGVSEGIQQRCSCKEVGYKYGRLNGEILQGYIQQTFAVNYHQNLIYNLLKSMNITWTTSRSKHPKQNSEIQEDFKKIQIEVIKLIPGHVAMEQVAFWFQDEARFGQQNTITRLWSKKGCRPRAVKQQQFDYAYFFGAVCPATGETEALIAPHVDKEMISRHLEQI
ncbi:MAG: hypothetical protein ACI88A_004888 [Paraglaciecola sp.]